MEQLEEVMPGSFTTNALTDLTLPVYPVSVKTTESLKNQGAGKYRKSARIRK
jgi:hypothetical protein